MKTGNQNPRTSGRGAVNLSLLLMMVSMTLSPSERQPSMRATAAIASRLSKTRRKVALSTFTSSALSHLRAKSCDVLELDEVWSFVQKPTNPGSGLACAVGSLQECIGRDHTSISKNSGETAHVERWNNTLRQRLRRFVRKTLSFSKNQETSLKIFIHEYNITARHKYLVE